MASLSAADRATTVVDGKSYPVYEESEAPPVKRVSAVPSGSSERTGRGGELTVRALVDGKGNVRKTHVVEGTAEGSFRADIVNAVKASKYPVMRDPARQAISYVVMVKSGLYVGPAQAPRVSPKLAELISDPKYIRGALGIKALLVTDPKTGEVSPGLLNDVKAAGLAEGIELIALPIGAVQPKAITRVAPFYPDDLRRKNIGGMARFIFVIGADGKVKGLYCVEADHPDLAVAAAAAVAQWRFAPAKIENTPIPVIAGQMVEFNSN